MVASVEVGGQIGVAEVQGKPGKAEQPLAVAAPGPPSSVIVKKGTAFGEEFTKEYEIKIGTHFDVQRKSNLYG